MPHPCTNLRAICPKSCYILFHIVPVLSTFLLPDSSCISQWAASYHRGISGQSYCPLCNKIVLWWALPLFRRQSPRVYCPPRIAGRYHIPIRSTATTNCRKISHTYQEYSNYELQKDTSYLSGSTAATNCRMMQLEAKTSPTTFLESCRACPT